MIYGPKLTNDYRPGARLSFGDFGSASRNSMNVFVGEFFGLDTDAYSLINSTERSKDTDQLEVHGKDGIYFTLGGNNQVVGAELTRNGELKVKSMVSGYSVNLSDIRLKTNIKPMNSKGLSKIKSLNAISYDFIDHKGEDKKLEDNIKNFQPKTTKENEEMVSMKKDLDTQKKRRLNQVGFSAQEVQKFLPDLVSQGEDGYLRVNYIGMIPSLVEAIKEQQVIIEQLQSEVEKLKRK